MEIYNLLRTELPFALNMHYNLIYAYSYPESDIALEAMGNVTVNFNLLRGLR